MGRTTQDGVAVIVDRIPAEAILCPSTSTPAADVETGAPGDDMAAQAVRTAQLATTAVMEAGL
jgi:hypothetical protein